MAKVVAAMSGGVDSSVAAGLLVEQGHEVIGVHMKLHDAAPGASAGHCCGLDDALDARRAAEVLGIPFYVMDLRDAFQRAVMDDLADTYVAGRTPNPCVQCNGVLKFRVLLGRALALGATHLATGHYAQVEGGIMRRAADPAKDQTYFLWPVTPKALGRTLFPVGGMVKTEVRDHARRLGLPTAEKPESQDVCFLPDDDHARYVAQARPDLDTSGEIVDEAGKVLGWHEGYVQFTVGQRKGLGLALGYPAYVLRIEPESRRVVVAPRHRLEHRGLTVTGCVWHDRPSPDTIIHVRIRHRGGLVPAKIGPGDAPQITLLEPVLAAAPGQSAVFYVEDRVVGGGVIDQTWDAWLPDHLLGEDRLAGQDLRQAGTRDSAVVPGGLG